MLVVGADKVPAKRKVTLGSSQNNQWIVLGGLQAGEQVIVEGFQKMMVPGAPVKAMPWNGSGKPQVGTGAPVPAAGASAPAAAASQ